MQSFAPDSLVMTGIVPFSFECIQLKSLLRAYLNYGPLKFVILWIMDGILLIGRLTLPPPYNQVDPPFFHVAIVLDKELLVLHFFDSLSFTLPFHQLPDRSSMEPCPTMEP